eukprot:7918256-Lingulodinium_polyedra.AAC.1
MGGRTSRCVTTLDRTRRETGVGLCHFGLGRGRCGHQWFMNSSLGLKLHDKPAVLWNLLHAHDVEIEDEPYLPVDVKP